MARLRLSHVRNPSGEQAMDLIDHSADEPRNQQIRDGAGDAGGHGRQQAHGMGEGLGENTPENPRRPGGRHWRNIVAGRMSGGAVHG